MHFLHPRSISSHIYNGFTVVEILVAAAVSSIVIGSAVTLGDWVHQSTVEDKNRSRLNNSTDKALRHIGDEIAQGQKILLKSSELPNKCRTNSSNFVFAIEMPAQAYTKSDYRKQIASNQTICPVIYGLKKSAASQAGPFILTRYGAQIDDKGYYINPNNMANAETELILGVSNVPYDARKLCPSGWTNKVINGIELCVDPYRRTAQLSISAELKKRANKTLSTKRSDSASTHIIDPLLFTSSGMQQGGGGGSVCTNPSGCSFFGQQIKCDGTAFLIDVSGSMGWHRMNKAKQELQKSIASCPDGAKISIYKFNHRYSKFSSDMVVLNKNSRSKINNYIHGMRAGGGTLPWDAMNEIIRNKKINEVVLLTDGWTSKHGYCIAGGGNRLYADCYSLYNQTRTNQEGKSNPLKINAVALDTDCSDWLGPLATKNGGTCVRA